MKKIFFVLSILLVTAKINHAQLPNPVLDGYWQNWNNVNSPYMDLDVVDPRYNVLVVAFAEPLSGTDMTMNFLPSAGSIPAFITKLNTVKAQGKVVLLSIGGANSSIDLSTIVNRDLFVNSVSGILNTYGFDGIDLDIENGSSILNTGGTISAPANPAQINLIDAVNQIMINYRSTNSKKMLLTVTPETVYVQGGQSSFGGIWGGYLPLLSALHDSIDLLQVQLYNSGTMYGLDGAIYSQGTSDFIVAMTEAVIQGFNTSGGNYTGFPPEKIAVGLPACPSAAGGGYTDTTSVKAAMEYLIGNGPQAGAYTLLQAGAYPNLRGMMTWSVNWDAVNNCASTYQYANNFTQIFGSATSVSEFTDPNIDFEIYPNPVKNILKIDFGKNFNPSEKIYLFNLTGGLVSTAETNLREVTLEISSLPSGIYLIRYKNKFKKFIVE